ncbi:MAG: 4,5-dihydroxyphthalate dehydrogenase [Phycisphaeraceae bacterium]|nr:4,5-dihydroxyphthalate dehydrogenase [Phycisphaeraceae bacterium]
MARSRLGIGIIGTGWVAGAHAANFLQIDGCRIVAVCSRRRSRAAQFLAGHSIEDAGAYDDLDAFLAHDGLDVVVICTPHPNHPAETIASARAGKHIVIEKPVALNRTDLNSMVRAVRKAKVLTSVCFELRWIGLFRNIKAMMAQKLIGNVYYGECSYYHGVGPWYGQYGWNIKKDMAGDALLTAGCHALDGLIWLMGSRVTEVAAFSNTSPKNPLKYEYDPNSVAILKFDNGSIGKVSTSIECRQPYLFPVLLQGDKGTIWNDQISTISWPGLRKESWASVPTDLPDSGDVADHPYLGQLQYFVDCIRTGKRPHNDLEDAAHTHEVIFAINEAIKTRKNVRVRK